MIVVILMLAAFVRLYRVWDLLGFYYDQGRDALVIWDLIHNKNIFLIGPTTGIEGIFLGPAYYYLLAPFYWLGGGNPIFPAIFLGLLNVLGIYFIYRLGKKYFNIQTGLLAAFLASLSFVTVMDQRWLANPNPLAFLAVCIYWFLLKVIEGKTKYLILVSLFIGLGLQFEAASAIFFIPSLLVSLWVFRKSIKLSGQTILLSTVAFGSTLLPQLFFDFRNNHLLFKSFERFVIAEKSFIQSPSQILLPRLHFYLSTFMEKFIFANSYAIGVLFLVWLVVTWRVKSLRTNPLYQVGLIWVSIPLLILLIYTGNHGYIWGYYFTGVYSLAFLLVSAALISVWRLKIGRLLLIVFMYFFISTNVLKIVEYLFQSLSNPTLVVLGNSQAAVDWVYQDAGSNEFNVDVYVPPVISYAYDYLFLLRGSTKYQVLPAQNMVSRLYTIYEVDLPHPERLQAWLDRQAGIGQIEEEKTFGAVIVQMRLRYKL